MDTAMSSDTRADDLSERFKRFDIRHNPERCQLDYPEGFLRKASILIPLSYKDGEYWLTLTVRSKNLTHHAGYVAFPGGMTDDTDKDEIHTALREAEEEIGLRPDDVKVIGVGAPGIVKPNSLVYPVIGLVPADFKPIMNEREVSVVFQVPLKRFLTKERLRVDDFNSPIGATYHIHHFEDDVNGEIVDTWGMTASYCVITAIFVLESDMKYCFYQDYIMDKNSIFGIEGTKHVIKQMLNMVSKL